jgi:hypothetical protein
MKHRAVARERAPSRWCEPVKRMERVLASGVGGECSGAVVKKRGWGPCGMVGSAGRRGRDPVVSISQREAQLAPRVSIRGGSKAPTNATGVCFGGQPLIADGDVMWRSVKNRKGRGRIWDAESTCGAGRATSRSWLSRPKNRLIVRVFVELHRWYSKPWVLTQLVILWRRTYPKAVQGTGESGGCKRPENTK